MLNVRKHWVDSLRSTARKSSKLARPDLGSDYSLMEFTRPENNVLNLHDVRYDFLVTTIRPKPTSRYVIISRAIILLLAFYNAEFSERCAK